MGRTVRQPSLAAYDVLNLPHSKGASHIPQFPYVCGYDVLLH